MEFASFGLLQLATTNRGSRPEIQDDLGGRGKRSGRRRSRRHQQGTLLDADDELLSRQTSRREVASSKERNHKVSRGGATVQTDDQRKHPH